MEPMTERPRRHLVRRALIAVPVCAALAVAAGYAIDRWREPAPTTYTTTEIGRGEVVQAITASGTLSPVVQIQVGSQVSGRVAALFADYNDQVTKGQVIARIEPDLFESAVAQAKARLTSAEADLQRARAVAANAKAQHARVAGLLEHGAVAAAEVDAADAERRSADANVTAARARVTEAKGAVEQAQANLAYTTIRSPIDGIVIARSVDVGQTVAASLSAPTLFVIAGDLREMEVHTTVAESDVGQLSPGMKVEFSVDAFPEKTFTGAVKQVRFEATNVSNVVTYDAVVSVRNDALELRPGMTANATFVIEAREHVLVAPSKALRYRPANAARPARPEGATRAAQARGEGRRRGAAVWVLRDGAPVRVAVETGLSDGTTIEITGGELREGDLVITADSAQAAGATPAPATNRRRGSPRVF